jgi:hypothetical protein
MMDDPIPIALGVDDVLRKGAVVASIARHSAHSSKWTVGTARQSSFAQPPSAVLPGRSISLLRLTISAAGCATRRSRRSAGHER